MLIKEWIQYQKILQNIEQISLENKKKLAILHTLDHEKYFDFMHDSKKKLLHFSSDEFLSFKVTTTPITQIRLFWIEIYKKLCESSELDYGDLEEIDEWHDQINVINEQIETSIYSNFIQRENCPELIQDWILYTALQTEISMQEQNLAKKHIKNLTDNDTNDQIQISYDFIIKNLEEKHQIMTSRHGSTPEFNALIEKNIQLHKLKMNMNLNRIQNLNLENEFRIQVNDSENEIKMLEVSFFSKTLDAMELML